jgi:predicted ATPase
LIATIPGRGYQFTAKVELLERVQSRVISTPRPRGLVGRAGELLALEELLRTCQIVTILGPAGVGKTVLARATVSAMANQFAHGAQLVELAPVRDADNLPVTLAAALGLKAESNDVFSQLADYLSDKELLLVLDNCEHHAKAVAALVASLALGAQQIKFLITSQVRLGLNNEHVFRLEPLATPNGGALHQVKQSPAADLFTIRAAQNQPGFQLTPENAQAVNDICCRLDGIPLALELAATRVSILGVEGVLARLDQRLMLLSRNKPGAGLVATTDARHSTLRAALSWSYDLLSAQEQFVFACLSVFHGGFDASGLQAVAIQDSKDVWSALDTLDTLIDRALVAMQAVSEDRAKVAGEPRFLLLETMAEFASERLFATSETQAARARHANYMLVRLNQAHAAQWTSSASILIGGLIDDVANVRAALTWANSEEAISANGNADILVALVSASAPVWQQAASQREGLIWCEAALRVVNARTPAKLEAALLLGYARLSNQRDAPREIAALERAVALFDQEGDCEGQFLALCALAKKQVWRHDLVRARTAIKTAESVFDPMWPSPVRETLLQAKTYLIEVEGQPEKGEPYILELLGIMQELGDQTKIHAAMIELAQSYAVQGKNWQEAANLRESIHHHRALRMLPDYKNLMNLCGVYTQLDRLDDALTCARKVAPARKSGHLVMFCIDHVALLACKRGKLEVGAHLVAQADAHQRQTGFEREVTEARARQQIEMILRAVFSDVQLKQLFAEGEAMTFAETLEASLAL